MSNDLFGTWAYRSFLRDKDLSTPFDNLRFGAGTMVLEDAGNGVIQGSLGGSGWSLDLQGHWTDGDPNMMKVTGSGEIGGELWVYDYLGYLAPAWPDGVEEVPSILGSIIRTEPHSGGTAPAGFVASWYGVKQD